MTGKKFRSMHKASRVLRHRRPPLPKEGKTGGQPYPRVNPPLQRKTAVASPKAREIAVTRRSGPDHAEVPPMKERPAVGGRKPYQQPRKIQGRTRGFQLPESRANKGPTEGPRTPELELAPLADRALFTPHRDRRPANRARKRQGGADARQSRRSCTQVVDSPSKATGHSQTLAPDAEATAATLHYDRSK